MDARPHTKKAYLLRIIDENKFNYCLILIECLTYKKKFEEIYTPRFILPNNIG